jgi:hypothetical protein
MGRAGELGQAAWRKERWARPCSRKGKENGRGGWTRSERERWLGFGLRGREEGKEWGSWVVLEEREGFRLEEGERKRREFSEN